jgi:hypothetical protein
MIGDNAAKVSHHGATREVLSTGMCEGFPIPACRGELPAMREQRRYLPYEVFLGLPHHLVPKQARKGKASPKPVCSISALFDSYRTTPSKSPRLSIARTRSDERHILCFQLTASSAECRRFEPGLLLQKNQ